MTHTQKKNIRFKVLIQTIDINRRSFWIGGFSNTKSVPGINGAMNVNNIRNLKILSTIKDIGTFHRTLKQMNIVTWSKYISTLLNEKINWKRFAEQIRSCRWCLKESKFRACLIHPLTTPLRHFARPSNITKLINHLAVSIIKTLLVRCFQ